MQPLRREAGPLGRETPPHRLGLQCDVVVVFWGKRGTVTVHLEPKTQFGTPSLKSISQVLTLLPNIADFLDFENLRPFPCQFPRVFRSQLHSQLCEVTN